MMLEREFKVGDRVCSFRGKTGVVVRLSHPSIPELRVVIVQWDDGLKAGISESQVWHEGATPKFDYMKHQAQLEHEQALKLNHINVAAPLKPAPSHQTPSGILIGLY